MHIMVLIILILAYLANSILIRNIKNTNEDFLYKKGSQTLFLVHVGFKAMLH